MSHTPVKPDRRRVSGFIIDYLLALPLGCAAALAWANARPESYYRFANATAFVVNDVGMAFFFALITKEVVEATLPGGALHPWRRAALPVVAATGSVIVSIAIYLAVTEYFGEHMLGAGWVAACAIDIPGTYVIARMIFGRHPAVPFLLLLAIFGRCDRPRRRRAGAPGGRRAPADWSRADGGGRQRGRRLAAPPRQELLAVPARSRRGVLVGAVPRRRAPRTGTGAHHPVLSPRPARSRPDGRTGAGGARHHDHIRALVAGSGGGRASDVRTRQRRRAAARPRGRDVGDPRSPRSDGRSASSRRPAWRSPPACTSRCASAGGAPWSSDARPPSASCSPCSSRRR